MSLLNSVLKVFVGDKSKQDVKSLMPLVEQVKSFEAALEKLSHNELREKTVAFKAKIEEGRKEFEDKIVALQEEANNIEDIDRKEAQVLVAKQLTNALKGLRKWYEEGHQGLPP